MNDPPSVGVVTPHNAQRGALDAVLPSTVTANTVEKYQGGERDIIAVSVTVSDSEFARREEMGTAQRFMSEENISLSTDGSRG
jgi:superfamily I DNA and/or RNA helicase